MNQSFKSLLDLSWQSIAYGFGFFGRQLIVYLTLPIITNLIPQDEFGVVSILTSFYTVINTVTNVGLPSATFRFYNDEINHDTKQEVLGTSQALFFIVALGLGIIILIFSGLVSKLLLGTSDYSVAVMLVAGILLIETMNYYGTILLRLDIRPAAVGIHSFLTILSQMGLAILFVRTFQNEVEGYWLGFLLGSMIGLVLMIWMNRKRIVFTYSASMAKDLLAYGIPLIPANFSISFLQLTDRYFLRSYLDLETVAIYAIGYKVGSLVNLMLAPFRYTWPNFAFSKAAETNAKKIYRDVVTLLILGCTFVTMGTYVFRADLINFLSPISYQEAGIVVPWISGGMILYGIYPVITLGPKLMKNTKPLAWISLWTAGLNIVLLLVLVPWLGLVGAGMSVLFSYLFLITANYIISRRYYSLPIDWRRITQIIVLGMSLVIADEYLGGLFGSRVVFYLSKVIVMILFPAALILLRVIPFGDLKSLATEFIKQPISDNFS